MCVSIFNSDGLVRSFFGQGFRCRLTYITVALVNVVFTFVLLVPFVNYCSFFFVEKMLDTLKWNAKQRNTKQLIACKAANLVFEWLKHILSGRPIARRMRMSCSSVFVVVDFLAVILLLTSQMSNVRLLVSIRALTNVNIHTGINIANTPCSNPLSAKGVVFVASLYASPVMLNRLHRGNCWYKQRMLMNK